MSDSEYAEFAARLRQRREQLESAIAGLQDAGKPVELDQTLQGRLSRLDAITQQEMARAGRAHLVTELKRVEAALQRVDQARYGACCRCGLPIEPSRLGADPAAALCMDCLAELASERERHGRLYGRH